jgi:hypothetical protein
MSALPLYTLTIEGNVLCCVDIKRGISITNGAEAVVADLAAHITADFDQYRIIYRDTTDTWDGIAHAGPRFVGFVPLHTKDRAKAIALARAGIDRHGRDWPR